jgi:murein DD-endopeptidase MepM/ murein hydrolase activator NlpD
MRLVLKKFLILGLWLGLALAPAGEMFAQSPVEQLRRQIAERNAAIVQLEEEIAKYQKELSTTSTQAKTLKSEIDRLNKTIQKLDTDIKLTRAKIDQTSLTIDELTLKIGSHTAALERHTAALESSLRSLKHSNDTNLVEMLLASGRFSSLWEEEERLHRLQQEINRTVDEITELREAMIVNRADQEVEKQELTSLTHQLADQKTLADQNRENKDELLTVTKNQEENYKQILATRVAEKKRFEQELFNLENQLRITIDPGSLPAGKVLAWPLGEVFITQRFGKTADSGRLYVSGTHNGIDLRAAVGTPVKAAAAGVVTSVGNTDVNGCASYGRWVLIGHNNNLSTLYAHLSLNKVLPGQTVAAGELIGYSGQTGYATGPHLHFTVYASAGVEVMNLGTWYNQNGRTGGTACSRAGVSIPVAPPNAYLDPLLYL